MHRSMFVPLVLCALNGCCTDIFYQGALTLNFSEPFAEPGLLEILVSGDVEARCAIELPWSGDGAPACAVEDSGEGLTTMLLQPTEDLRGLEGFLFLDTTIEDLSVLVLHEGLVRHDGEHHVVYEDSVYGRGICRTEVPSATVEIELSP